MVQGVPAAGKDGKAKLLAAFAQVLSDRQSSDRIATKEEEAEKAKSQQILAAVSQYTADSIVRGLADLQLEFGTIIGSLSNQLSAQNRKCEELERAIAVETDRLQDLQQTRVVADALYLLRQEHQENLRSLEQQATDDRQLLETEIGQTRKVWQQEQEEAEAIAIETAELLQRERQRQEEDYAYEIDRSRTIATDDYEEKQRQIDRQIQATTRSKEQDWAEREQVLQTSQEALETFRRKAAAFPTELEEAIKKSREDGIRDANQDAKVKADLLEKEWEATQQGYELQVQSLEAKIQKQADQIAEITAQLQIVLQQSQALAGRAFEGGSKRSISKQD